MTQTAAREPQHATTPRAWRLYLIVLVAALLAIAGGTWFLRGGAGHVVGAGTPALVTPVKDAFGISLPSTKAGVPYTFGSMPLCLSGTGTATIDSVHVAQPDSGVEVDAFAVRALSSNLFGAEQVALSSSGFGNETVVSGVCDSSRPGSELAVQLSKAAAGTSRATGLVVTWHAKQRKGTLTIPAHIVLCQGDDENAPGCVAL